MSIEADPAGSAASARLLARVNELTRANAQLASDLADRERSLAERM
jgi:hypothetical protein